MVVHQSVSHLVDGLPPPRLLKKIKTRSEHTKCINRAQDRRPTNVQYSILQDCDVICVF